MFGRRFKPSLWGTLAALAGVCAGIALGQWQLGRAQQKVDLAQNLVRRTKEPAIQIAAAPIDGRALEYRAVEAHGQFQPRGMVLLDNRVHGGIVGYEVIMPLRLSGADMHVLVNRGWIAGTGDRGNLPQVPTPTGEVWIRGIAVVPGQRRFELSARTIEGAVWQNLTIERYRAHMQYAIQPILIEQTNETPDGLLRQWSVSQRDIDVHRSYALQWFSLALLVALTYLFLSLRRVSDDD